MASLSSSTGSTPGRRLLEESNVNPMLEITRLIMVQRAENGAMIRDTESSHDEARSRPSAE